MTIRVQLCKLAVVAVLGAAGTITAGSSAYADNCETSVSCGFDSSVAGVQTLTPAQVEANAAACRKDPRCGFVGGTEVGF